MTENGRRPAAPSWTARSTSAAGADGSARHGGQQCHHSAGEVWRWGPRSRLTLRQARENRSCQARRWVGRRLLVRRGIEFCADDQDGTGQVPAGTMFRVLDDVRRLPRPAQEATSRRKSPRVALFDGGDASLVRDDEGGDSGQSRSRAVGEPSSPTGPSRRTHTSRPRLCAARPILAAPGFPPVPRSTPSGDPRSTRTRPVSKSLGPPSGAGPRPPSTRRGDAAVAGGDREALSRTRRPRRRCASRSAPSRTNWASVVWSASTRAQAEPQGEHLTCHNVDYPKGVSLSGVHIGAG